MASVYVPVTDAQALKDTCEELRRTMETVRGSAGEAVELAIMGDFNRHDQLWGGDEIRLERQGEADPIIDLMNEYGLASLLPRGTKTWSDGENSTTIDLVLATGELRDTMIKCRTLDTEHGSDHRSIETVFDIAGPSPTHQDRLLFKNAPWKDIKARIADALVAAPMGGSVQQQTDRLMGAVLEAVHTLTPRAKPSPYAKRWWTTDLTQLRRI